MTNSMSWLVRLGGSLAATVLLFGGVAEPAWQPHQEAGVEIDVPVGWMAYPDDETGILTVESPDGLLVIVLWVPDDTWDGALASLDTELETIIELPSPDGEPRDYVHNGMNAHERSGLGTVAMDTVQWRLTLVHGRKPVIALAFASPVAWAVQSAVADSVVATLRALN